MASGQNVRMPLKKDELPSTLQRSPRKVRRAYAETLDSAEETYDGNEERAHRTAWSAVKHIAEKQGDHWELEDARDADIPGRSTMDKDELVDALQRHSRRETDRARG